MVADAGRARGGTPSGPQASRGYVVHEITVEWDSRGRRCRDQTRSSRSFSPGAIRLRELSGRLCLARIEGHLDFFSLFFGLGGAAVVLYIRWMVRGASGGAAPFPIVASYRDAPSAYIAASALDAAEIPYRILDEHTVGVAWLWSHAVGGVKIEVPEEHVEQAIELLGQDRSDEVGPADEYACPACGSSDVRQGRLRKLSGILALLSSVPLVAWSRGSSCRSCGHRWRDEASA